MTKLNLASGQRPFKKPWLNIDLVQQGYPVDIISDMTKLPNEVKGCEAMVCHHGLEHLDMSVVSDAFAHWHSKLVQGGKLLIAIPDVEALIDRWKQKLIDDYIFNVNLFGAYQGRLSDLHRWSYTEQSLNSVANERVQWGNSRRIRRLSELDQNTYEGSDLAMDWWVLMIEFQK